MHCDGSKLRRIGVSGSGTSRHVPGVGFQGIHAGRHRGLQLCCSRAATGLRLQEIYDTLLGARQH